MKIPTFTPNTWGWEILWVCWSMIIPDPVGKIVMSSLIIRSSHVRKNHSPYLIIWDGGYLLRKMRKKKKLMCSNRFAQFFFCWYFKNDLDVLQSSVIFLPKPATRRKRKTMTHSNLLFEECTLSLHLCFMFTSRLFIDWLWTNCSICLNARQIFLLRNHSWQMIFHFCTDPQCSCQNKT